MLWLASAEYADGTTVDRYFPYNERNYLQENLKQFELESWLIACHEDCVWYSVCVVDE